MTSTNRGTQSLCIVLSILTYCTLWAQSEPPRIRNIVLVHGAWQMVPAGKAFMTFSSRIDTVHGSRPQRL